MIKCRTCKRWNISCDSYCGGDGYEASILRVLYMRVHNWLLKYAHGKNWQ